MIDSKQLRRFAALLLLTSALVQCTPPPTAPGAAIATVPIEDVTNRSAGIDPRDVDHALRAAFTHGFAHPYARYFQYDSLTVMTDRTDERPHAPYVEVEFVVRADCAGYLAAWLLDNPGKTKLDFMVRQRCMPHNLALTRLTRDPDVTGNWTETNWRMPLIVVDTRANAVDDPDYRSCPMFRVEAPNRRDDFLAFDHVVFPTPIPYSSTVDEAAVDRTFARPATP